MAKLRGLHVIHMRGRTIQMLCLLNESQRTILNKEYIWVKNPEKREKG